MRNLIKGVMVTAVACILSGCASPRNPATFPGLGDLDREDPVDARTAASRSDKPEKPASSLPSTPSANGGGTKSSSDPVSIELTIQPDSIVQVGVEEDPGLDGSYPVNDIGAIELGYVGPVILYNKTEKDAAQKIADVLTSRHFKNATVRVRILRASYDKIRVNGAVNQPGILKIGAGDTISLNDALLRSGGLIPSAKGARVRVVRGGLLQAIAPAMEGEEYSLATGEGLPNVPDVELRNNDVVYVFPNEATAAVQGGAKEIIVLGEVSRPGIYSFSGGEPCTLLHLMFKMGSLPLYANKKAIRIVRRSREGVEHEIRVDADRIMLEGNPGQDIVLENGDRVIVPARRISLF